MTMHISYKGQLDSLRAFSVIIVLLSHWVRDAEIADWSHMGRYGVDLFFVLSGFLLTSILLKQKSSAIGPLKIIKGFFIKRALRLFPAYYALLIGLVIISFATGFWIWNQGNAIYYFTYTANFLFFFEGYQSPALNHIWSLCVEEQFYLILPWIVIFLSRNRALVLLSLAVLASLIILFAFPGLIHRVMVYGNLPTLGLGVLCAYCITGLEKLALNRKLNLLIFCTALTLAILTGTVFENPTHELWIAVLFSSLVVNAYFGFTGWFGALLNNKGLQYVGMISYGLYIYHRAIPHVLKAVLNRFEINIGQAGTIISYFILLSTVALFSYHYIEKPFMKLKKKFDY